MIKSPIFAFIVLGPIIFCTYPVFGATVFYADGAFTKNGIEWCEENKPLYDLLGDQFFEHHQHSIESRVCANLMEDPLWQYSGPDRVEKLIERSLYFSELEIAESQQEAKVGVVDPNPVEVPGRDIDEPKQEVTEELKPKVTEEIKPETNENQELNQNGGGCLIATAAFGSELSTQVQMLREIRDSQVMNTNVGSKFLSGFNQFYYLFSPAVADLERQNPAFKELVKLTITPMLFTLSLLNNADIDSDIEMLEWGMGILLLNTGFYFVIPLLIARKLKHSLIFKLSFLKKLRAIPTIPKVI